MDHFYEAKIFNVCVKILLSVLIFISACLSYWAMHDLEPIWLALKCVLEVQEKVLLLLLLFLF